jgi:hypothetical protein
MRYIDNFNLLEVTNFLTEKELGLCIINGKLEAFSLAKKPSPLFGLLGIKEEPVEFVSTLPVGPTPTVIKKERAYSVGIEVAPQRSLLPADGSSSADVSDIMRRRRSSSLGSYKMKKPLRNRATSLGDLSEPSTRKLLCDLISTLNEFFPGRRKDLFLTDAFCFHRSLCCISRVLANTLILSPVGMTMS